MFGKKGTPSALPKGDSVKKTKPKLDPQDLVQKEAPIAPVKEEQKSTAPKPSQSTKEFVDLVQDEIPVEAEPKKPATPITETVSPPKQIVETPETEVTKPVQAPKIEVEQVPEPVISSPVEAPVSESAPSVTPDPIPKSSTPKVPKSMDDNIMDLGDDQTEEVESEENNASNLRMQRARNRIWLDLRDGIDLKALARMKSDEAREEVYSAVEEIARFRNLDLTPTELKKIAKECGDDMLGFGPLEELLEIDGIADIMINGPETIYIELNGKIERSNVKFRDNQHLTTICQRIVGAIGRRVDESSPICDARLPDGSRVNVIIPPLAVDGACMTIRKFTKDKLTLEKLLEFGSMTPSAAKLIMAIGRCRVNVLVSGGTGSGKTTMLNCLTRYIEQGERIVTCEDACELQLQQPHVVRLETRPPNLEGVGEVTMRDLVKNCLRMRPERIIVGEVRGPEAFDLLQAMNTGHDGSMGTVHANNPREALSRMENMIAMGGLNLPIVAVREQISAAVNVVLQVQRLRDGSRKVTHISEITGMEGDVVTMQDLFKLEYIGENDDGSLITELKSTGMRPKFWDKARQFGVENLVLDAMEEAYG